MKYKTLNTTAKLGNGLLVLALIGLFGCASKPQIAIDPKSITDMAKYQNDMSECNAVAASYDLSEGAGKNAAVGAAAGAATVAGIATAVAGAVFAPAIPFILAGGAVGGTAGAGMTKSSETAAREGILAECMTERGYKAYTSK
jgi:outer membrane lipoprotein SlyB